MNKARMTITITKELKGLIDEANKRSKIAKSVLVEMALEHYFQQELFAREMQEFEEWKANIRGGLNE